MSPEDAIIWPAQPAGERVAPPLPADEVHVWAAWLEVSPATLAGFGGLLSPPEQERAARFHFDQHRRRFVAARGLLRAVLSRYLLIEPGHVEFAYGIAGKPSLAGNASTPALQFNLAHSQDLALLAVTQVAQVGVDVERIRPFKDAEDFVARFFSPREAEAFKRLPKERQSNALFNLWTRKEAWLKATGEGIGASLHRVEVSFAPGEPARLVAVPESMSLGLSWSLIDLRPGPGFAAALAVAAAAPKVKCWRWNDRGEAADTGQSEA